MMILLCETGRSGGVDDTFRLSLFFIPTMMEESTGSVEM